MKKYLVTGGAGFIGSHIVHALIAQKHFVRVLDNFSTGKISNLQGLGKKIELIKGDIRSPETCIKATKGMDYVLHQAALRSVPKSVLHPHEYNDVNINGTLSMLEAAVKHKIKMFVFASSSSVYGDIRTFPEKENFLPQPISPYALSKIAGEYYCRVFSNNYTLPTASLRYFNVFGPRQSHDDEYAVVIPKFISCMLNNEQPPIYGTGKQSRDFTFVDNVVQANILATRKGPFLGEVFNVASGKDYSVLDVVRILNRITGKDMKPVFLPKRTGDVFKTNADISRAKKMLGFRPTVDFARGLERTVAYCKQAYANEQT